MLEIKTDHGVIEGTIEGDVGELVADITVIAHALYMQIKEETDEERAKSFYQRVILTMTKDFCDMGMKQEADNADKTENPDT